MPLTGITRAVSSKINACELSFHARQPIDVGKATAEHEAYKACLAGQGIQLVSLPADPALPDSVFVEDTAVVVDEVAVMTNMGAVSRRLEGESMAGVLARYRPLKFIKEPGTIEGGDVMRIGRSIFVGLSQRTNREGIGQLTELLQPYAYEVQSIEVTRCLHLKSACSYVGQNTILINPTWIDAEALRGFELLAVPEVEPAAANALLVNDLVLMPA